MLQPMLVTTARKKKPTSYPLVLQDLSQEFLLASSPPFKVRQAQLQKFLLAANNRPLDIKFMIMESIGDPLIRFPAKPDVTDWSMEEVDMYYQVLLVRCCVKEKVEKCIKEVEELDPPRLFYGVVTLTYASLCMYSVIHKKLSKAQEFINRATGSSSATRTATALLAMATSLRMQWKQYWLLSSRSVVSIIGFFTQMTLVRMTRSTARCQNF